MFRFVTVFLVLGITVAGYFFLSANSPLKPSTQPVELIDNEQPDTTQEIEPTLSTETVIGSNTGVKQIVLPPMTSQEKAAAKAHVTSITANAEQAIEVKTASHFVTAEQILELPELKEPEVVEISNTDQVVAVIVSAPITQGTPLSQSKQNELNASAAQTFAVKIPSFKKTITQLTEETGDRPQAIKIETLESSTLTQPAITAPIATAPSTTAPLTSAPLTTAPLTTAPLTTAPLTTAPSTTAPLATAPLATAPLATAPLATAPLTTAPLTTAPLTTAPLTTAPLVVEPKLVKAKPQQLILNDKALAGPGPQIDSKNAHTEPAVSNVKILTTVTGEVPGKKVIKQKLYAPAQIQPEIKDLAQNQPIFDTLKENIAELSDIKVEELLQLVTGVPTSSVMAVAKPVKTNSAQKVKPLVVAEPIVAQEIEALVTFKKEPVAKLITLQKPVLINSKIPAVEEPVASSYKKQQSKKNRIQLRELLNQTESDQKRIFYLHAVNSTDEQGIWGIIQKGLMGTFSKGINLPTVNGTLKALIPKDADEKLDSEQSSFLGKLLNYKVLTTYVYNYEQGNIGKNPDYIKPGQQLIIVTFTEKELMGIYQHFVNQAEQ